MIYDYDTKIKEENISNTEHQKFSAALMILRDLDRYRDYQVGQYLTNKIEILERFAV
jgi:hypothetical protein